MMGTGWSFESMVEISGCGRACPDSVGGRPALVEHNRSINENFQRQLYLD